MKNKINELYSNTTFSDDVLSHMGGYRNNRLGFTARTPQTITEDYDRDTADRIASEIAELKGLNEPLYIGSGSFGVAYDITGDKILKITNDRAEATENLNLVGKNLERIAEPYHVFSVKSKEDNIYETYAIILEKLQTNPNKFNSYYERFFYIIKHLLNINFYDWVWHYIHKKNVLSEEEINKINKYYKKNPEDYEYYNALLEINDELKKHGITSIDFMNPTNLGYKPNGKIAFFDVGMGNIFSTSTKSPEEIEVAEDGSAKFTTQDSIGRLDFSSSDDDSHFDIDERIKSGIEGSSTVKVKDKCKLGGKGNTSVACNQGDVDNLIIEPMEEEVLSTPDSNELRDKSVEDIKPLINDLKLFYNKKNDGEYLSRDEVEDLFHIFKIFHYNVDTFKSVANEHLINFMIRTLKNREYLREEVDAMDSNNSQKTFNALVSGKKDVGLLSINDVDINEIKNSGLKGFKIKQDKDPEGENNMFIIYRPSAINDAVKLYRIMKKHGGYAKDTTPEEAYEIGKLFNYTDDSIDKYISNKYGKYRNKSTGEYVSSTSTVNDDEMNLNENDILTLDELPFKEEIQKRGGKIYSVGGAVRDEFLGKESKDLDILITGIPMDELEELLSDYGKVDSVGQSFGILKFKPEGSTEDIDIALPRTETPTGGGGHKDFNVKSDHTLPIEDDLFRRDFTINAIAKDANGNVIDPYGGMDDLKDKIIRVVNPDAFSDDPLRMLRAVQFASRFDYEIEPKTMELIKKNSNKIKEIPSERILTEFDKIVKKGNARTGAYYLKETGLLKNIFGGDSVDLSTEKWDNVQTMGEFIWLLTNDFLDNPADFYKNKLNGEINTYKEIKALKNAFDNEINDPIHARSIVHNMYLISPDSLKSDILPDILKNASNELLNGKYPKTISELDISGNDLMSLGLKGKEIGDAMKSLLIKVYADKVQNRKNDLLNVLNDKNYD